MFDVMAQDVVADDVWRFRKCLFKLIEPVFCCALGRANYCIAIEPDRSEIEDLRGLWIDLEVDRKTKLRKRSLVRRPEFHEVEKCHQVQGNGGLSATLGLLCKPGNRPSLIAKSSSGERASRTKGPAAFRAVRGSIRSVPSASMRSSQSEGRQWRDR
ncbi:hypothetical protein [Tabrizicola sp.]|uniref:hypothetical protein n=1 Tax=Tabrizicola sp. TaxID=2005166 RepID=UPI0035AD93F1